MEQLKILRLVRRLGDYVFEGTLNKFIRCIIITKSMKYIKDKVSTPKILSYTTLNYEELKHISI